MAAKGPKLGYELIARAYSIGQGLWSESSVVNSVSGSVRCVTEME